MVRASLNIEHFTRADYLMVIAIGLLIASILLPWVTIATGNTAESYWAFHRINGNIGYLLSIIIVLQAFLLFSRQHKQAMKSTLRLFVSDHALAMGCALIITLGTVIVLQTLQSLEMWSQNFEITHGAIFSVIGAIMMGASSYWHWREDKKYTEESLYVNHPGSDELLEYKRILHESSSNKDTSEHDNMTLPL